MILSLFAVAFIAFAVFKLTQKPKTRKLLKPDWQPDTVYLFQYKRPNYAPNISPYCIKIESYLRANNIKYETIIITLERSSKGFVPFVELNGHEYADTELILYELQKAFNVKDVEDAERSGALRGLMRTFDLDVFFITVSFVSVHPKFEEICGGSLTNPSFWSNLFSKYYKRRLGNRAKSSSIGGFSETERIQVLERDIIAAENVLGNRKYFGGDIFTVADAAIYGQLAAVYLFPVPTPMKAFIQEKCTNLERYIKDVTNTLFSDIVTIKT